jgi:hypothetical protein
MKSRLTVLPVSAVILLVVLGCVFARSAAATRPPAQSSTPPAEGAKAPNDQSQREARVTAGTKNQVAFDTTPGSQRMTVRYVLEITDASGQVTLHDLKRPRMIQRRTIMVPLPDLAPGDYKLVVIAEGNGDSKRSATLLLHVDPK